MDKEMLTRTGFSSAGLAQVRPAIQGIVDAGDLSGAVSLIWRKGEEIQLETVGYRDIERQLPMTRDTLFRIASMTKPITSVAALMLMEEGKLGLDDAIVKWLPEFADMKVLKDINGPLDDTYPNPRDITVEDLLTHRSGLAYGFSSPKTLGEEHDRRLGAVLDSPHAPDEWLKRLSSLPLSYPAGERLHYSHATDVLGFLVGRVAGMPFRDFLMQRIFEPLGMTDTDFYIPPEKRERAAVIYQQDSESGALRPVPFKNYDTPPEYTGGGGGLISTVDDYLKFARMLLGNGMVDGVRLLKPETVALMATNRLTDAQREIPFLGMPLWAGMGFGLGLSVIMDPVKHEWMGAGSEGSFGWPGAFGTWWQADPKEEMILIFLIQNYNPLTPDLAASAVIGNRMGARIASPMFQKIVYGALQR